MSSISRDQNPPCFTTLEHNQGDGGSLHPGHLTASTPPPPPQQPPANRAFPSTSFPTLVQSQPAPSNVGSTPAYIYSLVEGPSVQGVAPPPSPVLFQNFGGSASFPDIYEGDIKKWEEHFRTIQRAYKEFGKDADFAIRVLTEDFTLPFPYAWPPEDEQSDRTSFYNASDKENFDFFLHPGRPVPKLLQPLHATTQAYFKKRRLEQLALSYASRTASLASALKMAPSSASQEAVGGHKAPPPGFVLIAGAPPVPVSTPVASFLLQEGKEIRTVQLPSSPTPPQPQGGNLSDMSSGHTC
ncbi:uncharacterized protein LOC115076017 [Rhinatrema bivittatum]|uniref:uncharacterized protein LOC115076017 n=1 Tax=Rhinatrema bivittatum TaxID=194408 RepID=UPI00112A34A1|nr:uncharacterized protein LOC115076017 [Rhinatrema bivittatum]